MESRKIYLPKTNVIFCITFGHVSRRYLFGNIFMDRSEQNIEEKNIFIWLCLIVRIKRSNDQFVDWLTISFAKKFVKNKYIHFYTNFENRDTKHFYDDNSLRVTSSKMSLAATNEILGSTFWHVSRNYTFETFSWIAAKKI